MQFRGKEYALAVPEFSREEIADSSIFDLDDLAEIIMI